MEEVFRQEKKYLISMEEFYRAGGQFGALLHEDPHNGAHGYRIRSLYFDTLSDRDFHEKEDGVELRRKLRLRLYDPRGDFAMLEMKQKQGMYQKKRSLRLARADAQRVARGDYTPLAESTDPFAQECYAVLQCHTYRPKTVVEYRRKAFIAKENRIRITLDHQIAASESHLDPFDPALVPDLWVYYCCAQYKDVPNRFFAMPSARNRIMGLLCYLHGIKGFLHWGYNFYNSALSVEHIDPYFCTHGGCAFPSGDPFLVYPGPDGRPYSSVRAEVQRLGLDDMRALQLLEQLTSREHVLSLIYEEQDAPFTFEHYPHSPDYLLSLSRRVHQALAVSLP